MSARAGARAVALAALLGLTAAVPAALAAPSALLPAAGQQSTPVLAVHAVTRLAQARQPGTEQPCRFGGPPAPDTPWSLARVQLDQVWLRSRGRGVTVAVIDTGVDHANPQLAMAVLPGSDLLSDGDGRFDPVGHGTMVAGIIAARRAPDTGFSGLAPDAKILPVRQFGAAMATAATGGDVHLLAEGIHQAVQHGAQVVNISQDAQNLPPDSELEHAVGYAVSHDVVIVAAAGNDGNGRNADTYPAGWPGVLAVGASDRTNHRATFSQDKAYVDVLAPGVDVYSTVPRSGGCRDDGTSFAAPYVAGVAALLRARHPHWSAAQVIAVIEQTAQRTTRGPVAGDGWGVVDPLSAVEFTGPPPTSPSADPVPHAGAPTVHAMPLARDPGAAARDRHVAVVVFAVSCTLILVVAVGARVAGDAVATVNSRTHPSSHDPPSPARSSLV